MKYTVVIATEAEANLIEAFDYIYAYSPLNAQKWMRRIRKRIASLKTLPLRRPIAPETHFLGKEIREAYEPPYRILFEIDPDRVVHVLHIRHASRRYWGEPEE